MKKLVMAVILVSILAIAFSGAAFSEPAGNHGEEASTGAKEDGNNKAGGKSNVGMPHLWNQGAVLLTTGIGQTVPTEDRITVKVKPRTTLGDIQSISWSVYIVTGYLPHVDMVLDTDDDGIRDAVLVCEGAYQNGGSAAGFTTGAWGQTFPGATGTYVNWSPSFGTGNPSATMVDGTTDVWLSPSTPNPDQLSINKLSNYQSAAGLWGVNEDTPVLFLELEVDNWIADSEAWVDDITVTYAP